jgi:hypothetical protein
VRNQKPDTEERCVVGIRTAAHLVKAFDVCIKGPDAYVNYSDVSVVSSHGSYHASGQQHIKIGKEYAKWDGGPAGQMEPLKLYREPPASLYGREQFWTIGWEVSKLEAVLPRLAKADVEFDAQPLPPKYVLAFEVSVIGPAAIERENIVGFPIMKIHLFGESLRVEIVAFTLTEQQWEPQQDPLAAIS